MRAEKRDNMTNILTNMKHIHKYLEEDYVPDQDIYRQFLKQYREVKAIRTKSADNCRQYSDISGLYSRVGAGPWQLSKRTRAERK